MARMRGHIEVGLIVQFPTTKYHNQCEELRPVND